MDFSEYGNPAGKPVVYFHGVPGSPSEASVFDAPAREQGLRILCFDRFTIDHSSTGTDYYRQIAQAISETVQGARVDFIGFSLGAHAALEVAALMSAPGFRRRPARWWRLPRSDGGQGRVLAGPAQPRLVPVAGEVAGATGQTRTAAAVSHVVRQCSGAGSGAGEITEVQSAYLPGTATVLCPRYDRLYAGHTAISPALVSQRLHQ